MAVRPVPRSYGYPIRRDQLTRNGVVPDWRVAASSTRYVNHALAHLRKVVYTKSLNPASIPAASSSTLIPFRFYCRPGAASTTSGYLRLRAIAMVLPSDNVGTGGSDGKWRLVVNSGADTASAYRNYPGVIASPTMDDVAVQQVTVTVTADTEYACRIEIDGCRILSVVVYEEHAPRVDTDDTGTVCNDSLYSYGAEITDAQHANDFVTAPHNVWLKNASHLWTLSPESESGFWTISSTSLTNILDGDTSVAVPSNSTAGVHTQVQYYNAAHTNNVVCVFAAYAANTNGAGGDGTGAGGEVRLLHETTGTIATLSSFTATAAGEWKTVTCNVDGSIDTAKTDVFFKGDGTNTLVLEAVSLYVYG